MKVLRAVIFVVLCIAVKTSSINAQEPTQEPERKKAPVIDWKLILFSASGQTLDLSTTARSLHNSQCVEKSSLFGPHPKTSTLVMGKTVELGITVGGQVILNTLANRESTPPRMQKLMRWLSRRIGYASGLVGFGASGVNIGQRCN
jgi:hypothetical protein